eukprot:2265144-Rhodomonas_salina.6
MHAGWVESGTGTEKERSRGSDQSNELVDLDAGRGNQARGSETAEDMKPGTWNGGEGDNVTGSRPPAPGEGG